MSSAYCATCVFLDNAFGRSCIRKENKIGATIDPCGMPISIFLIDEYVFPTQVQIHRSDNKFLMYWNIIPVIPMFFSL